jgi:hypothetical protein
MLPVATNVSGGVGVGDGAGVADRATVGLSITDAEALGPAANAVGLIGAPEQPAKLMTASKAASAIAPARTG